MIEVDDCELSDLGATLYINEAILDDDVWHSSPHLT